MAEKSLFYNAMPDSDFPTGYDRNYNGDDISDWFSIVCDTGVVKNGLAVSAGSGLSVNVAVGKATIKGKGYINNTIKNITLQSAPTGANPRYDMIVLRMNNTQTKAARVSSIIYVAGTSSVPTVASLTRTAAVYDLLLAYVTVHPNATSLQQSNITDCRGNTELCPWFTAVKGYDDYYDAIIQQFEDNGVMASAGSVYISGLASSLYNDKYSLIEVYCNGLKEENTDYTVSTSGGYITITFTATKSAGAQISVVLNNFIDGEGLPTALAGYNEWVQAVEDLQTAVGEYTYVCNGVNDNENITNLGQAWLTGGTDYASKTIKIVGNFGYTNAVYGEGTSASPYRIFNFAGEFTRRLILDFTCCSDIEISAASGKYTVIFATQNLQVVGANIIANNTEANTQVKIFSATSGKIYCENCRFWINAYSASQIAQCGTFKHCRGSVMNTTGNSYCFQAASNGILRIEGGEYYAYTGASAARSAIVGQSMTNAVSILYAVNAPTNERTGYFQTNALYQANGNGNIICCTDLISELPLSVISGASNIRGTIALSKPEQM